MSQRSPRIPADEARLRILAATRELLLDRPFAALTVGDVMARAGLTRTVFYRHFEGLPQLAPELLPDAEDPLVDQVLRGAPEDLIDTMITGLVGLYATMAGGSAHSTPPPPRTQPSLPRSIAPLSVHVGYSKRSSPTRRTRRPTRVSSRSY